MSAVAVQGRPISPRVLKSLRSLPGSILGPLGRLIADDLSAGRESFDSLAAKVGSTGSTLCRMAAKQTVPRWELVEALCSHYGLTIAAPKRKKRQN